MAGPLAQPILATDVRSHLAGMEGWLTQAATVAGYDDDYINSTVIPAGIRSFEREAQFRINAIQVISAPDGTYNDTNNPGYDKPSGGLYETFEEQPYPYLPEQADNFMDTWLREKPVRTVQRVRFVIGQGNNGTGTDIFDLPAAWYNWSRRTGKFTILPLAGAAAFQGVTAFSMINFGFSNKGYLPSLIAIDYIAGMPDNWASFKEWADLKFALGQYCAAKVCGSLIEMYGAGLLQVNVSMGAGGSQSVQPSHFEPRRKYLEGQAARMIQLLKEQEDGYLIGVA